MCVVCTERNRLREKVVFYYILLHNEPPFFVADTEFRRNVLTPTFAAFWRLICVNRSGCFLELYGRAFIFIFQRCFQNFIVTVVN